MIDYSLLTEEDFSKMKLLNACIQKYGREMVLNQTLHFDPSVDDMKCLYALANEHMFENKLHPEPIFKFQSLIHDAKGAFGWQDRDENGNIALLKIPIVSYRKHEKDSFLLVVSTLLHELIHYKDFIDGPLSYIKSKEIKNDGSDQYVGEYDVHGAFFNRWTDVAYENGIIVEKHFTKEGQKYLMVDDNGVFIRDDGVAYEAEKVGNGDGSVDESDSKIVKYAKRMFSHLKSKDAVRVEVKDGVASFMIE